MNIKNFKSYDLGNGDSVIYLCFENDTAVIYLNYNVIIRNKSFVEDLETSKYYLYFDGVNSLKNYRDIYNKYSEIIKYIENHIKMILMFK